MPLGMVKVWLDSDMMVKPSEFVVVTIGGTLDDVVVVVVGIKVITDPSPFVIVIGVELAEGIVKPSPDPVTMVKPAESVVVTKPKPDVVVGLDGVNVITDP